MSQLIYPGLVLRNHYAIVRELGHGGFGRTYLAKDQHRFDELCVLKEFSPQVQGSFTLKKSQELFEREAEILYKLKHPQIPRFRELFRETIDNKGYLFFVQDYVEGFNYRSLLNQQSFTEAEVMQLLFQILPILDYIHSYGVIHRDISPDNMIQRQSDGLPMLIDFGGVKLIQAKVESELAVQGGQNPSPTRLGKVGYAPDEQMRLGMVYPNSDLYALAATMLVLLTRKEPQQLIDPQTLNWNWRKYTKLNPKFGEILDKMLAYRHGDRFLSVQDVLVALSAINPPPQTSINPTQPILNQSLSPQTFLPQTGKNSYIKTPLLVFVFILTLGVFGWLGGRYGLNHYANQDLNQLAKTEEQRQEALREQRRLLGVDFDFFVNLVNEEFYNRYPEQRGRTLTDKSSDSIWREKWDKVADEFLQRLAKLSDQSRIKLGNYSINDLDHLKAQMNQLQLSSQSLYDLADAKFFDLFPEQSRNVDLGFPMGQVWQAITNDVVNNLEAGTAWKRVEFASKKTQKTLKDRLKPGEGKIYIAHLNKNQVLQVRLKSPQGSTLLSIYTQKAQSLLEDSPKNRWSGRLPDSGDYQVVVVSESSRPFDYELTLETR
ncbi:serine/threonine-protein kinase [Planktothrix agardhii]|jgi:Serine/threonine protein kinase|uniref:non-specific serine/threonine protein kinase n=2 Tax=Planktothrix agardhii TaxID=1160 RepID=A0A073CIK4_PLAA1|nr:serine/threonine-protein kinase [Planktothrix agardhii]MCF3606162.1 serine/threonine protein kinase [Planktothrix agardhii 1033]BBD56031.1 serine/threonine protein kinase [Planktothrix agardhii NIES-204]KEI68139.1 serine/threonine kinase [Planktothrix agardhii NIVA-CYA 126/8]MCB8750265.1 serine/threonine protein kinase [Planktothrix agardhii 1810]MCB8765228.1 serine/threonine protein kinase [Planktothrix agardhii 1809]